MKSLLNSWVTMPPAPFNASIALFTSDSGVSSGYVMRTAFCALSAKTAVMKTASIRVSKKKRIISGGACAVSVYVGNDYTVDVGCDSKLVSDG